MDTFSNLHPDADLLSRLRHACRSWEKTRLGPTSSLTGGGAVRELESRFSCLVGYRHVVAVNSGTMALRIALQAAGVRAGDEVICPAYDWPATSAAIRSLSASPVYAAVGERYLTIDPLDVKRRLSRRTAAVVCTHLFGSPADVPGVRALVDPIGIPVIEDCAQAVGASLNGIPVGALGSIAAFSLGPGKAIDAEEGGLVVAKTSALSQTVVRLSQHPLRQMIGGDPNPTAGYLMCRIHPAAALLALDQLDGLDERLVRREVHAFASHAQGAEEGFTPAKVLDGARPSWFQVPVVGTGRVTATAANLPLDRPGATWLDCEVAPPKWLKEVFVCV